MNNIMSAYFSSVKKSKRKRLKDTPLFPPFRDTMTLKLAYFNYSVVLVEKEHSPFLI